MEIHGYAIVSADDCIADARGFLPDSLKNDADWDYFQSELDRAAITVLGRASHEAAPNARGRRRLILSRRESGLVERADGWWWNPERVAWESVVERLDLRDARVAVPGGQPVFDLFLKIGFDAFHLSRAMHALLPGGTPIFSGLTSAENAEARLARHGLSAGEARVIDTEAGVTLTVFERSPLPA